MFSACRVPTHGHALDAQQNVDPVSVPYAGGFSFHPEGLVRTHPRGPNSEKSPAAISSAAST